jgi:hypothetical protein
MRGPFSVFFGALLGLGALIGLKERESRSSPEVAGALMSRERELEWLAANRTYLEEHFAGQWIAVCAGLLVASGSSLAVVLEEARAKGFENPFIAAVRSPEFRDSAEVACLLLISE